MYLRTIIIISFLFVYEIFYLNSNEFISSSTYFNEKTVYLLWIGWSFHEENLNNVYLLYTIFDQQY